VTFPTTRQLGSECRSVATHSFSELRTGNGLHRGGEEEGTHGCTVFISSRHKYVKPAARGQCLDFDVLRYAAVNKLRNARIAKPC
jgi:hypothetical protein